MASEHVQAAHHVVEGRLPTLVHAVRVVDLARAVDGDPDEEVVLRQEHAPLVGQERPVGLERVQDLLARLPELIDELDGAAEEVESHERRLAALPGE